MHIRQLRDSLAVVVQISYCFICTICGIVSGFFVPLFLCLIPATLLFAFVIDFSEDRANVLKLATECVVAALFAAAVYLTIRRRSRMSAVSLSVGLFVGSFSLAFASLLVWTGALVLK